MKLWRQKGFDEAGNPQLEEVTSANDISSEKPLLFIFPGQGVLHRKEGRMNEASALFKSVQGMLGLEEPPLATDNNPTLPEVLVVSYDSKSPAARAIATNNFPRLSADQDAQEFVECFLNPVQARENQQPVTFLAGSYGTIFAENVRKTMQKTGEESGKSSEEIRQQMQEMFLLSTVDVSQMPNPDVKRPHVKDGLEFPGISFLYMGDKFRKAAHLRKAPEPIHHENAALTITAPSNGRINVFADAPDSYIRPRWDKTDKNEIEEALPDQVIAGKPMHHRMSWMIVDGHAVHGEEEKRGAVAPIASSILRTALRRTAPLTAEAALETYTPPFSTDLTEEARLRGDEDFIRNLLENATRATGRAKQGWQSRVENMGTTAQGRF